MSFRIERGHIHPNQVNSSNKSKIKIDNSFRSILEESISQKKEVRLSAHAQQRLEERDIDLQEADMNRINEAFNNLEEKGARESLMLYKDMALIASVNNRTIITALQAEDIDIVTNIDSAVIIK